MTPTLPRTHVLNLESLAREIRERAERAFDVDDRYSDETDEKLCAEIGLLIHLADTYVWGSPGDYEDEKGIERLQYACQEGQKAWSYLRSDAPAIQRTLTPPSQEDRLFIAERARVQHRRSSPTCRVQRGDKPVLEHLYLPGDRVVSLRMVLFKCASLAHARRVLKAIGLKPVTKREGDREFLEVLGETIVCD